MVLNEGITWKPLFSLFILRDVCGIDVTVIIYKEPICITLALMLHGTLDFVDRNFLLHFTSAKGITKGLIKPPPL